MICMSAAAENVIVHVENRRGGRARETKRESARPLKTSRTSREMIRHTRVRRTTRTDGGIDPVVTPSRNNKRTFRVVAGFRDRTAWTTSTGHPRRRRILISTRNPKFAYTSCAHRETGEKDRAIRTCRHRVTDTLPSAHNSNLNFTSFFSPVEIRFYPKNKNNQPTPSTSICLRRLHFTPTIMSFNFILCKTQSFKDNSYDINV